MSRRFMERITSMVHLLLHGRPSNPDYLQQLEQARKRQDEAEKNLHHTMEALTSTKGHK